MPTFLDVHRGQPELTARRLAAAHTPGDGVHVEHTWLDRHAGRVFCLSQAPDREAVVRLHERAGAPTSEVYELSVEVCATDLC